MATTMIHVARSPIGAVAETRRVAPTVGRRLREESDLSLGEVARAVGVSRATVSRWERGHTRATGRGPAIAYLRLLHELAELQGQGPDAPA